MKRYEWLQTLLKVLKMEIKNQMRNRSPLMYYYLTIYKLYAFIIYILAIISFVIRIPIQNSIANINKDSI